MKATIRGLSTRFCISLIIICAAVGRVCAQPSNDETLAATNSTPDQIAALQLQLTNAWHQVEAIVCQPPPAFRLDPTYHLSISSPGWFHPGALTPDFNRVDVRKTQEFPYASRWVSSDITPTMMFRGDDLEFNSMTKLFYTNRDLPKKRLTDAEMLEINTLYRTIGQCQNQIESLQNPQGADTAADTGNGTDDTDSETNGAAPPKAIAAIERVPQQTRILYGSIAIGTLLVLVIAFRFIKKKSD